MHKLPSNLMEMDSKPGIPCLTPHQCVPEGEAHGEQFRVCYWEGNIGFRRKYLDGILRSHSFFGRVEKSTSEPVV